MALADDDDMARLMDEAAGRTFDASETADAGPVDAADAADAMPSLGGGADWARGLDASSADAAQISSWLEQVYRAHYDGDEMPAAMQRLVAHVAGELTGSKPVEPAYGPGLWAKMPQRGIDGMVEARPVDLLGDPDRDEIDLMMLHTIRMGRWLTTHYVLWAQTLTPCWILHDDVVQEVFALKCYADLIAADPNGGLYAPTLQSLIHQARERAAEYLAASDASKQDHAHHLADPEHRRKETDREAAYADWLRRRGEWDTEPRFTSRWRYRDAATALDGLLSLGTPPEAHTPAEPTDENLRAGLDEWTRRAAALRQSLSELDGMRPGSDEWQDLRADLAGEAAELEHEAGRRWRDWREEEARTRDRLDRTVADARRRLASHDAGLDQAARESMSRLADQGGHMLDEDGHRGGVEGYRARPIASQADLIGRIGRLTDGDPVVRLDGLDTLMGDIRRTLDPAGEGGGL